MHSGGKEMDETITALMKTETILKIRKKKREHTC